MNTSVTIRRGALVLLGGLLLAPAAARAQTERTVAAREGMRLEIHAINGGITVRSWDRPQVHLVARHDRGTQVQIEEKGSSLTVHAHGTGKKDDVTYTVTVPRWLHLSLHGVNATISVDGTSGRVEAHNVKGGIDVRGGGEIVDLNSVEGPVTLRGARGRISIHSVNSSATVRDAVGSIEAGSVNSAVRLLGIDSRNVEATSVNGSVEYDGAIHRDGVYKLGSHNGGVTITIPPGTGADVRVSTFTGSFSAGFPVTFSEARRGKTFSFVLGSGGAQIELQSFNGSIRLRRPGER
jgi:DUF4097 and DUF4098 domain-containing protein YvlB